MSTSTSYFCLIQPVLFHPAARRPEPEVSHWFQSQAEASRYRQGEVSLSTWWDGKVILLEELPSNSGQENLCWETYGRRSSALFWLFSSESTPSFASVLR